MVKFTIQLPIEKYWKIESKIEKRLVIGQSEILTGQDFDCGCRSPYSASLRDTSWVAKTKIVENKWTQ